MKLAAPVGVILAGGTARRMGGGDKTLLRLAGTTILEHIVARILPQVSALAVNANGDPARFAAMSLPVILDTIEGSPGPLAGILAALEWVSLTRPGVRDVVTVPADSPFLPLDLVARLIEARDRAGAGIAIAAGAHRRHPVIGLWPVALAPSLRHSIEVSGTRRVGDFIDQNGAAIAEFSSLPFDPFHNVNTPDDLTEAERLAASL